MSYIKIRKCDTCGKIMEYAEFCLFHHQKQRHFCSFKCLKEFVEKYEKEGKHKEDEPAKTI